MHKPKHNKFPRRHVVVPSINHTVMADLIDYRKFSRKNAGYKYILVVIDAFSRFAHTAPLKTKKAEDSAAAMDTIFEKYKFPPVMFASDKGLSFVSSLSFTFI